MTRRRTRLLSLFLALLLAGCASGKPTTQSPPSVEAPAPPPAEAPSPPKPTTSGQSRPFQATVYSFTAALEGRTEQLGQWELPWFSGGLTLSPDYSQALLFQVDPEGAGPPAALVDLSSGQARTLALPGSTSPSLAYGGWLPDGRLLVVGSRAWVGDSRGEAMKPLTEPARTWTAALAPDGSRVALWGPGPKRAVRLVDLTSGAQREVEGFIPSTFVTGLVHLAWSPDSNLLAGTAWDHDSDWRDLHTVVIDPQTGQQVRTIADLAVMASMKAGIVGQRRDPKSQSQELILVDEAGKEQRLGDLWVRFSPDLRWLLYTEGHTQPSPLYAMELATGRRVELPFTEKLLWTSQGDLLQIEL